MHDIGIICTNEQKVIVKEPSEMNEEFNFKFISKNDFNSIYKRVQRRRREELEKKKWDIFLRKKILAEKNKNRQTRHTTPTEQCVECFRTLHCNDSALNSEKPNCLPFKTIDTNDESLEFTRDQFSRYLLSPVNENHNDNAMSESDYTEKWKTVSPKRFSLLKKQQNENEISPKFYDLPSKENTDSVLDNSGLDQITVEYDFKKIQTLRSKMELSLRNIFKIMKQGPILSDKEDIERIKQRSVEFSNRFKRNYFYHVQCNVNEIEKRLSGKQKFASKEILTQKMIIAHQSCLKTLQVIEKNLPNITVDSLFNFFNDFFLCICDLTKKLKFIFGLSLIKTLDDVAALCEKVMDAMIDLIKVKPCPRKIKKERKNFTDVLWMYSNKNSWQAKATLLAKSKFALKNQKNIQNKDVSDKSMKLNSEHNDKLTNKNTKINVRKRQPVVEDEIKTMMEMTYLNENDNSEVSEELEIDVNPTNQVKEEKKISTNQSIVPQTGLLSFPVECTDFPTISSLDKKDDGSDIQKNHDATKNVALICIKSNTEEFDFTSEDTNETLINTEEEEDNYKKYFKKFKKESQQYNSNILGSVTKLSANILEDIVQSVVEEIKLFP